MLKNMHININSDPGEMNSPNTASNSPLIANKIEWKFRVIFLLIGQYILGMNSNTLKKHIQLRGITISKILTSGLNVENRSPILYSQYGRRTLRV